MYAADLCKRILTDIRGSPPGKALPYLEGGASSESAGASMA